MEESNQLKSLFGFLQGIIYFTIVLEILVYIFYDLSALSFLQVFIFKAKNIYIYAGHNILFSKLLTLFLITIVSIGSRPKKKLNINTVKSIVIPIILGLLFFFGALYFYFVENNKIINNISTNEILYVVLSFLGAVLIHAAFDNISKLIKFNLLDDKFNTENESFEQNKERIDNDYSVNLPMFYYFKKRMNKGWFNITNPFRGTLVIGTPESGKSFSIIIPAIKQFIAKGFTMLIYDYKYSDLSEIAYYHYLIQKKKTKNQNLSFHVVNLQNVEYSRRVNPLNPIYFSTLADATETAESLVESLKKSSEASGADQFFTQSAINFLSAVMFFFSKYENGKHSTLPHVLAFMNRSYEEIFNVLFTEIELESILSPFKSAYQAKAYDQLEGQIGTLRVNISRLNTKESCWVFSGDDVDLRISNPKCPSIFVIANSPKTQSINSATNSVLLNRLTKLVNTKNNIPCGIIVDELPTIYFHKIQNLISTARSNKVAVILGLQELPQLVEGYGRQVSDTITSVIGNIISGAPRKKETLDWLEKIFGKVKQIKKGVSINRNTTSTSINEYMDNLIPSSKIADLKTGEVVAKLAFGTSSDNARTINNTYNCKINIDLERVKAEEKNYIALPKYYTFKSEEEKNKILLQNFVKIKNDVELLVQQYN